jgi:hypothetical protein
MKGWMSVEPMDGGGFKMDVSREDGLHIKATVPLAEGRPICRTLELSTEDGQIDRRLLDSLGLATLLRRAASAVPGATPLPEPHQLTGEFLALVADTYRKALEGGENTASAVARLGRAIPGRDGKDAPLPTARRWIQAARPDFLAKTRQGRKGG